MFVSLTHISCALAGMHVSSVETRRNARSHVRAVVYACRPTDGSCLIGSLATCMTHQFWIRTTWCAQCVQIRVQINTELHDFLSISTRLLSTGTEVVNLHGSWLAASIGELVLAGELVSSSCRVWSKEATNWPTTLLVHATTEIIFYPGSSHCRKY